MVVGSSHCYCYMSCILSVDKQDFNLQSCHAGTLPWYLLGRESAKPSVFIFHPSADQLSGGSATVVCLVSGFYPSALNVVWKRDDVATTTGVVTSQKQQDTSDSTYSLSSTLTLTKDEYNKHNLYSCEVTHETVSGSLVKSFKRLECSQ
ncbi:Ig kappa chain C region [Chelonia mydas]|uniref:Ig kappa chain C region n=1 Tax=Chelonia mydas TaxID=8469 RepID=M7BF29_CHEMY|nr:Ig kappa chain C region [Chelonia mydas]